MSMAEDSKQEEEPKSNLMRKMIGLPGLAQQKDDDVQSVQVPASEGLKQ